MKCQAGCPVGTDAGRYVQLAATDRIEEAYLVARSPNPFASVCGRVCAAPCEDVCRRGSIDAPVAIRALKRHLTEQYGVESPRPDTQQQLFERENGNGHVDGNQFTGHLPLARIDVLRLHARPFLVASPSSAPAPLGMAAAHDLALSATP